MNRIPSDCFGEITNYLFDPNDALSILFLNRSIYDVLTSRNYYSCRNVSFSLNPRNINFFCSGRKFFFVHKIRIYFYGLKDSLKLYLERLIAIMKNSFPNLKDLAIGEAVRQFPLVLKEADIGNLLLSIPNKSKATHIEVRRHWFTYSILSDFVNLESLIVEVPKAQSRQLAVQSTIEMKGKSTIENLQNNLKNLKELVVKEKCSIRRFGYLEPDPNMFEMDHSQARENSNLFKNEFVSKVSRWGNLRKLSMKYCTGINFAKFDDSEIAQLCSLSNLSCFKMDLKGLDSRYHFPSCRFFSIECCTNVSDRNFVPFDSNVLEDLNYVTKKEDKYLTEKSFKKFVGLKKLKLRGRHIRHGKRCKYLRGFILKGKTQLRELEICFMTGRFRPKRSVSYNFKDLRELRVLRLEGTFRVLSNDMFDYTPKLQKLDIEMCVSKNIKFTHEFVKSLPDCFNELTVDNRKNQIVNEKLFSFLLVLQKRIRHKKRKGILGRISVLLCCEVSSFESSPIYVECSSCKLGRFYFTCCIPDSKFLERTTPSDFKRCRCGALHCIDIEFCVIRVIRPSFRNQCRMCHLAICLACTSISHQSGDTKQHLICNECSTLKREIEMIYQA